MAASRGAPFRCVSSFIARTGAKQNFEVRRKKALKGLLKFVDKDNIFFIEFFQEKASMVSEISFEEFYKKFGYIQYPFNSFTAEDEKERQSRLFISTQKYSPILEAFLSKSSMLLLGDRGTGKTSILYDFTRQAPSNRLVCKIDDFSGLQTDFSDADFYKFVLRSCVNRFFEQLSTAKLHKKKISDREKILLTYFFINFADDATRGLAKRMTKEIQFSPFTRKLRGFYDFLRHPFNMAANFGVNLLADVVAKSMGTNRLLKFVA